ncbi:hypothetical protein [Leifsonia sp. TF02-11]|uniref:hypothetical protein n=1 Tax=Leifsonia sp. TF02-11 TaxID=2815212 RepID=UPI001AA17194|nr:hypothetical protein [Leifsonia sp. TF02-11]MBO1741648.1 hypothetical protein [Leifsonia sp. TF02-11]
MVDVFWDGIPNWITAGAAVLTLVAAAVAAAFAGRAAHWTKRQAISAALQHETGLEQLALARDEARDAKETGAAQEASRKRAERWQIESRLDQVAPSVVARARPGRLEIRDESGDWVDVSNSLELNESESAVFRTTAVITVKNVSDRIARVAFVYSANGVMSVRSGDELVLGPGEEANVSWERTVSTFALQTEEDLGRPQNWLFDVEVWIRDPGMNVRDTFKFNGDFRFFRRDGSRLLVQTEPPFPWTENVAAPTEPRRYERLEAGLPGISPAS